MSTTANSHPSSPSSRLRLGPGQSPISASTAARNSIISSSAKGWSPLQINKRDSLTSPLKPSPNAGSTSPNPNSSEPRRSSSSFKHVTKNSLVSNSPFKSPTTVQGAQAAGLSLEKEVIHERKTARTLGETPPSARGVGVASTAKPAIGLGITAVKPRSTSRSASGSSKAAVAGQRRVSTERVKVAFPERKPSLERRVSGSKENESPDVRASKRVPRSSMGLKGLATGNLVSKSPFKRVPSGGLSASASTKANESPSAAGPSPKSIPVEMDDVFSSPSPRRLSASKQQQRRASPNAKLTTARTSDSPTPSPPRSVAMPLLAPGISTGPSPLSRASSAGPFDPTATPTPHKSAMTPSRRLRGPRDLSAGPDSPTRKTVTFQSVPDVKEFETISAEPSADGSFEVDAEDSENWVDDGIQRDDSMEDFLAAQDYNNHTLRVVNNDPQHPSSPMTTEENEGAVGDESTTAAFMDTLIQEGLFSPPTMDTPAFEDQSDFELPLEPVEHDGDRPFLSTPSLGGSVHVSPLFDSEMFGETDNAGIPYCRTHHAERAALARSLPPMAEMSPLEQPDLPHNEEHQMLLNADAAQPALPQSRPQSYYDYNDPFATSSIAPPHAHQAGTIPDPFITIQTATKVLPLQSHEKERDEGGVPLGRTSHIERLQAARMLATQSLGLGMPRSPAISKDLTREASRRADDDEEPESEEEQRGDTGEMLFDASFELGQRITPAPVPLPTKVEEEKRRLPKVPAPAPAQIDVPSPITSPVKNDEEKEKVAEKRSNKFDLGLGSFALPFIGATSPFFNSNPATFQDPPAVEQPQIEEQQPSIDGHSVRESSPETDRPLTPPPVLRNTTRGDDKTESPHRLPDFNFNFEEIKFKADEEMPTKTGDSLKLANVVLAKTVETAPLKADDSIMTASASSASLRSEFGGSGSNTRIQDSSTTKVRQRISREMIRETIQQRIAEGSLSRRPSNLDGAGVPVDRPISTVEKDKDLPVPPAESPALDPSSSDVEALAPRMTKAHTTDATTRQASSALSTDRPQMRPRSQTQSAHDVLKQNERDGVIEEPKSALDRLTMGMEMKREVSGSIAAEMPPPPVIAKDIEARPVSILRNPYPNTDTKKQEGLLPPVKLQNTRSASATSANARARSPSPIGEGMKAREEAIIAKRREKEARKVSAMSNGSRRSRRSLSMGDADQEVEQVKTFRCSAMGKNPRLTLGIDDDQQSILDAFREEMSNIGSDRGYKVREKPVFRASYHEKVGHSKAGDIDSGKAWKSLRRPSDLHEHAAAIRAMRAREADSGKASGTIFVKVLGIEGLQVPIPDQQTFFCITLDNGIDYIRTPYSVLAEGAKVNQEFSLVEHPNFEFSLSLDIRRDPHILKILHEKSNPGSGGRPITPASPAKPHHGFRSLFSSPRKVKPGRDSRPTTPVPPASSGPSSDSIVNYLAQPGSSTIAKTHVAFKPIAKNCEARVLEIRYPMFAMFKGEPDRRSTDASGRPASSAASASTTSTGGQARKQLAKVTLQIFRLPPIPGLEPDEMPQCIDECLRGMRHHAWHEHEYHEGVLTQEGGDCTHPKRRLFKLIGGNLVAINEVTKKEVTKIDLRKATGVIDLNADQNPGTPKSRMTMRPRGSEEGFGVRPRTFEVVFGEDDEGIKFMADSDAAKESWMTTLEGLIGKIPSNPLWAELLATRQRERSARRTASSSSLAKEARRQASGSGPIKGGVRPVSVAMGASKTR
ncbi:hypothetical protein IAR55_006311 [Kwoniella newhampshirensis]|uniref:PH domain-containing protein n=1 Tax=Kwoniella newhampshirensis TaxID=1651941 RepID=A0AAW0YFR4_9TREE